MRAEPVETVLRGRSRSPLYVTAVGMGVADAADYIRAMHGPYRIPTLLKRVDQLSRGQEATERSSGPLDCGLHAADILA